MYISFLQKMKFSYSQNTDIALQTAIICGGFMINIITNMCLVLWSRIQIFCPVNCDQTLMARCRLEKTEHNLRKSQMLHSDAHVTKPNGGQKADQLSNIYKQIDIHAWRS
jgi:hypothetical protein